MSTGSISDASLKYMEEKHIRALLDEAMCDILRAMPEDPLAYLEATLPRPTPLRLMLSGLPGSGKGAQCERLVNHYPGLRHIDAEDLALRDAGEATHSADAAVVSAVVERVRDAEREGAGWVLDGFPQTRAQAIYLQSAGISPQRFIFLDVPDTVCATRCLHSQKGESPAELKSRLAYFTARKEELVDCFRPFYVRIDGSKSPDEVFTEIRTQCDAIERAK